MLIILSIRITKTIIVLICQHLLNSDMSSFVFNIENWNC